ncbi:hypothetical protein OIU34_17955 [Pararhizobium sp. BT-229]|uniref:hypothetical protein n=1 Tax=Pararhizobium sp. BT-229 TaxID=2986923 RepID=UPI0011516BDE|nr:hypothetical protein [Pararhizobium sp. BT-229]MCV9963763.1 hypothetical protein [Pararhizobium sp. BT-229]
MSYAKLAGDNPFLLWVLLLNNVNAVEVKSNPQTGAKDVILGAQGSRRFGVAMVDDVPYLGYVDRDREAMEAVKWTTAALLFNKPDKDYVALSSVDARMDTTQAMNPVPLRLFIPVSSGRLSAWKEFMPKELAIGPMTLNAKGEAVMSASPFRKLPLKVS